MCVSMYVCCSWLCVVCVYVRMLASVHVVPVFVTARWRSCNVHRYGWATGSLTSIRPLDTNILAAKRTR